MDTDFGKAMKAIKPPQLLLFLDDRGDIYELAVSGADGHDYVVAYYRDFDLPLLYKITEIEEVAQE